MFLTSWFNFQPNDIYSLQLKLFTMTGLWKIESNSGWKQFLYKIYHILNEISYVFVLIMYAIDAYLVRNDIGKLSTNICTSICLFGCMMRVWILHSKMDEADQMRIKLENNLNLENIGKSIKDKEIFERNTKEAAIVTIIFFLNTEMVVFFWLMYPVIDDPEEKKFPLPFPEFEVMKERPLYDIIYSFQAASLILTSWNIVAFDTIFQGFLSRIIAHFEILAKNIEEINEIYRSRNYEGVSDWFDNREENYPKQKYGEMESIGGNENEAKWRDEETVKMIKENVIHHKALLKILEEFNNVYEKPVFCGVILAMGLVGAAAYGIIAESERVNSQFLQKLFYVGSTLFDAFFYCYYATQLTDRSNRVKQALYDSPWYKMERKPKKLIVFIFTKLQKPPVVRAWKIFAISLKTFLQILRVSYDMIAILRQTKARHENL